MSFLFGNTPQAERKPQPRVKVQPLRPSEPQSEVDRFYGDLVARRPALLEEKLKLHGRIVDEFNLALLEKMSADELRKRIQAYIATYIRAERISLNQKELDVFTTEVIAEMIGFGPIEPLLKIS